MRSYMKFWFKPLLVGLLMGTLALAGCSGDDGKDGAQGPQGEPGVSASPLDNLTPEACDVCHADSGTGHQSLYNDAMDTTFVMTFTDVTATAVGDGTYTTTVTFTITKGGVDFTQAVSGGKIANLDQQRFAWATYNSATGKFPIAAYFSTANLTSDGNGQYTLVDTLDFDITATDADVYGYIAQGPIEGTSTGHVQLYREVYNAGLQLNADAAAPWTYDSASTVASCSKCHGTPYLKHGYRGAVATGLDDFVACKNCHYDTRPGSDAAEFFGDENYEYIADIMTDTHASHLNVFPYPQAIANCVTCHPGAKLDTVLDNSNFRRAVCESCHADVDPTTNTVVSKPLTTIVPTDHLTDGVINAAHETCITCHGSGIGASFVDVHSGYDTVKYASAADADAGTLQYTYTIDSITYDEAAGTLTIVWSAQDASGTYYNVLNDDPAVGPAFLGLPAERPELSEGVRILIGYYGWGTNNVANYDNHRKQDILDYSTYDATTGMATTTFALTDKLATYAATKLEVGIIGVPHVGGTIDATTGVIVGGSMVAVKSVTEGIVLADGTLEDRPEIVTNANCNACHDNILIHYGDTHGHTTCGNVNACIFCHNTSSPAHADQQGRSIDDYLHFIHTFPTEEEFVIPTFTTLDCEACHVAGMYNAPDQYQSSGSVITAGTDAVTIGPGSRACGSCHRAQAIREADDNMLASVNAHTEQNGYRIPISKATFVEVMNKIAELLGL